MIPIKSLREIAIMRRAGQVAAEALHAGGALVRPGATTLEISKEIEKTIREKGATPTFLGYNGFPAPACISINEQVIHGIPGHRKIKNGDLVKIDVGACVEGYNGDCADTFIAGDASDEARRLVSAARQSFYEGIRLAKSGMRVSDISAAIQKSVEDAGFSVVREFVGHGVGAKLHEEPEVPNYAVRGGHGPRLLPGMTIAVEPMINVGGYAVKTLYDGWTVVTADSSLSAHFEHTVLITEGEPELLTLFDKRGGGDGI